MLKRLITLDLILINILTLALVLVIFTSPVLWLRIILGFPFIIFFPGYVFIAVLFPRKASLSAVTRIALSLGLSISVVVLIGLMLNCTPWGIQLYSLLLSVSLFILLVSGLAWYARVRIDPEERLSFSLRVPLASLSLSLRTAGKGYYGLIIILLCAILGGSSALGYVMAKPVPRQPFTEFYILGIEGKADNYPLELYLGEEGKVIVGLVNHEQRVTDYRLEVTVGPNKQYELYPITLKPDEKWERIVGFTIQEADDSQQVEFRLGKNGGQADAIRYLWVNIKE